MNYLHYISSQIGVPVWLLVTIIVWTLLWRIPALWIAARKNQFIWFVILIFVNTLGILEMLYIFIFSKFHHHNTKIKSRKKRI